MQTETTDPLKYKEIQKLIAIAKTQDIEQQARETLKKAEQKIKQYRDSGIITEHDTNILKNKLRIEKNRQQQQHQK